MDTDTAKIGAREAIEQRFALLPQVVQDAITSADVAKRLRELAQRHQLHVDQWEALESEVQLTLLGSQHIEDLATNLATELKITAEQAVPLAADISQIVFEPIRAELERQLEHPEAKEEQLSAIDTAREQALAAATDSVASPAMDSAPSPSLSSAMPATTPTPAPVAPAAPSLATPAPAAPAPVARAPIASPAYGAGAASHERKEVTGDPYREQV